MSDPSKLGSGGSNLLPTVGDVGLVGGGSGSVGRGRWVGSRF